MVIDLKLYYVENVVEFVADYGDTSQSAYDSACSIYNTVVKEINSGNEELYKRFAERLKDTAKSAGDGYGFRDSLMDSYHELQWND